MQIEADRAVFHPRDPVSRDWRLAASGDAITNQTLVQDRTAGDEPKLNQNEIPIAGRESYYPTLQQETRVKQLLAQEHGVAADDVLLAAGSSEAIITIAYLLGRNGRLVIAGTTFPLFKNRTRVNHAQLNHYPYVSVELQADGRHDLDGMHDALARNRSKSKPYAVVVDPNNPTGTGVGRTKLLRFAKQCEQLDPAIPLIVDFAYQAFAHDVATTPEILAAHPKSIVLITPSKQDGLAGARAGAAIVQDPALKAALRRRLIPFNVSTPALRQWTTALEQPAIRVRTIRSVHESRAFFEAQKYVAFRPHGNFITIFVNKHPDFVTQKLAEQGVAIRSMSDQGAAVRGCVRVSFGTPEQNKRVVALLRPYARTWPKRTTRNATTALDALLRDPRIAALYAQPGS